ncbi:MAG: sulfatase-like hydrolase/transferase [Oligoflexales bacterium]
MSHIVQLFAFEFSAGIIPYFRFVISCVFSGLVLSMLNYKNNRAVSFVLIFLSLILSVINILHIKVNQSNISILLSSEYVDSDFIVGTIFTFKSGAIFIVALFISYTLFLNDRLVIKISPKYYYGLIFPVVVLGFLKPDLQIFKWQQMSFLESVAYELLDNSLTTTNVPLNIRRSNIEIDMTGKLTVPKIKDKNILFIFLEGASYKMIHEKRLGQLSKLLDMHSLYIPNFIHNQRQTHRGLYSILCGDYPFLSKVESKVDQYISSEERFDCLPGVLQKEGYFNVYYQGAMLAYMKKNLFMPAVGFDEIKGGYYSFPQVKKIHPWGIDDHTLFQKAYDRMIELDRENKKWFMSLLTVGTHHPYLLPGEKSGREEAFKFAGDSAYTLIKQMEKSGMLSRTIVFILSDEVAGEVKNQFNRGFLFVLNNVIKKQRSEDYFLQSDLMNSVLDILDIGEKHQAPGRSVFRQYDKKRDLVYADIYHNLIYFLSSNNSFSICDKKVNCKHYDLKNHDLFEFIDKFSFNSGVSQERKSKIEEKVSLALAQESEMNNVIVFSDYSRRTYSDTASVQLLVDQFVDLNKGEELEIVAMIDNSHSKSDLDLVLSAGDTFFFQDKRHVIGTIEQSLKIKKGDVREAHLKIDGIFDSSLLVNLFAKLENHDKFSINYIKVRKSNGKSSKDLYSSDIKKDQLIAHAGGVINGQDYTNSLEAINHSVKVGYKYIELDFYITQDDHVILLHYLGDEFIKEYVKNKDGITLEEFKNLKIDGLTLLTLNDLFEILRKIPQIKIVADTKKNHEKIYKIIAEHELRDRFIPQAYFPEDIQFIKQLGYESYIFTFYKLIQRKFDPESLLLKLKEFPPAFVATPFTSFVPTSRLVGVHDIPIYVHTINSRQNFFKLIQRGASGVYTDSINFDVN